MVGYLSQRFSLYGDLSIDENIAFQAEIHGVRGYAAERDRLLALTQLTPFRTRRADKLSGGMKQKLALACTLIHRPEVLLLDEPTTGVDPVSRREFWKLLSEFLAAGLTIVMATPYLDEAERCARVALLHEGRIMALDDPASLQAALPGSLIEVEAAGTRPPVDALAAIPEVEDVQLFGDRAHVRLRHRPGRRRALHHRRARAGRHPGRRGAADPGVARRRVHSPRVARRGGARGRAIRSLRQAVETRPHLRFVLALMATAAPAVAQEAPLRLTSDEAMARAAQNSLRVAELQARVEVAAAVEAGREAASRPALALLGGYTRTNHVDEYTLALQPAGPALYPDVPNNYRARMDLQWPIYTGGTAGGARRAPPARSGKPPDSTWPRPASTPVSKPPARSGRW